MNATNRAVELAGSLLGRVHTGTATGAGAAERWADLIQASIDEAIAAERERLLALAKAAPMTVASCKCNCGDCGERSCQCSVDGAIEMRNEIVRLMGGTWDR